MPVVLDEQAEASVGLDLDPDGRPRGAGVASGVAQGFIDDGQQVRLSEGPENVVIFRYADDQGTPLHFAPSEEELQKLYPGYTP